MGLGATSAVLQLTLMLVLPESPRWLVKETRSQQARDILQKVYAAGKDDGVEEVLHAIETEIVEEEATSNNISTSLTGNQPHT